MTLKQVLIISYYFPPAGGSEVQRSIRFVRYLREFGWNPLVLTTNGGAFPNIDPSLSAQIPDGIRIFRTTSLDPFQSYARLTRKDRHEAIKLGSLGGDLAGAGERIARWVRANLFLPDARIGWVPFATAAGLGIPTREPIDAILTTGPPHSSHLIGWALHRSTKVPWIADFRDPWVDINYYGELPHSRAALTIDAALEQAVLRHATLATTVSPFWQRMLAGKLKGRGGTQVEVIHNGYDEEMFQSVEPVRVPGDEFLLSHVGSLYDSRNPASLWRALALLRDRHAIPRLRLHLIGRIGQSVIEDLNRHRLTDIVTFSGFQSHQGAIQSMCDSDMLFFVIEPFPLDRGMITGKLYEYLASNRPILGIGPDGADAADLLHETKAGRLFHRDNDGGMAAFVLRHYEAWTEGKTMETGAGLAAQPYSWRNQTGLLAELLRSL